MSDIAHIVIVFGIAIAISFGLLGFLTYVTPGYDGFFEITLISDEEVSEQPTSGFTHTANVITARYQYVDGVHTYQGTINLPTPCDQLITKAQIEEGEPDRAILSFNMSSVSDFCAQVITPQSFFISFSADQDLVTTARLNGESITLDIIKK